MLEVEYPSDTPQTLGLSIVEPNAAGVPAPIGLDSGVDVDDEPLKDASPHWAKHRLVFWPRTNAPILVLTNHREQQPARVRQDSRFCRMGALAQRGGRGAPLAAIAGGLHGPPLAGRKLLRRRVA